MSDLKDFSDGLAEVAARREKARAEFNAKLGEPAVFIADGDAEDERFGVGYWKAEGGVVAYRRYANGFDPMSRTEFTNELLNMLDRVRRGV